MNISFKSAIIIAFLISCHAMTASAQAGNNSNGVPLKGGTTGGNPTGPHSLNQPSITTSYSQSTLTISTNNYNGKISIYIRNIDSYIPELETTVMAIGASDIDLNISFLERGCWLLCIELETGESYQELFTVF